MPDAGFVAASNRVSEWWALRGADAAGPERYACWDLSDAYLALADATSTTASRRAGRQLAKAVAGYHKAAAADPSIPSLDEALATYPVPHA